MSGDVNYTIRSSLSAPLFLQKMTGPTLTNHTIIAGFGVPGRSAVEWLVERGLPYCVVELNPQTVQRCGKSVPHIIAGTIASEAIQREAGIETASQLILAIPDDQAVLEAVRIARQLNPTVQIIARCAFTSAGLEASRRGADQVVVAERVVAGELVRILEQRSSPLNSIDSQ